jgi:hypothetical protein
MKKLLLALALLVGLPAFATPETTTITGNVLYPSGGAVTQGTVTATLSTAGTAPDGAGSSVVSSSVTATIGGGGAVSITLVPNDVITPSGTYYTVRYAVQAPTATSWVEKWTVTTAPDPVAIGAVVRIDTPPGLMYPISQIQDEGTDLTRRVKLNMTGAGVTCVDNSGQGRTDCTITGGGGGGGSPGGNDQDVQINKVGAFDKAPGFTANTTTGAVATKIVNSTRVAQAYSSGAGTSEGSPTPDGKRRSPPGRGACCSPEARTDRNATTTSQMAASPSPRMCSSWAMATRF